MYYILFAVILCTTKGWDANPNGVLVWVRTKRVLHRHQHDQSIKDLSNPNKRLIYIKKQLLESTAIV